MSMKRRDRRNRVLRTGESQRTDGRYAFKYIDPYGKPQYVYSWKLTPTDPVPAGKACRPVPPGEGGGHTRDLEDGIDHLGAKMTVVQLYALETTQRGNVRDGTKAGRDWFMRKLKEDPLGAMTIGNVRPCDAKAWAVRMKESGMAYQTIGHGKRALNAAFYTAVQNDFIRRNPFGFRLNEVIVDDTTPKVPAHPHADGKPAGLHAGRQGVREIHRRSHHPARHRTANLRTVRADRKGHRLRRHGGQRGPPNCCAARNADATLPRPRPRAGTGASP